MGNALLPPRPVVRKLEAIVPKPSVPSSVSPPAPAVQKEASSEWMVKAPGGALKPAHLSPPGVRGEVPDRRVRGSSVVKSPGEAKSTPPSAPTAQVALPAVAVKSPRPANAEESRRTDGGSRPPSPRPSQRARGGPPTRHRARREAAEERGRADDAQAGGTRKGEEAAGATASGKGQATGAGIRAPRILSQS